jgi:phenylacetic acid degradation operon negative regulatory protein
MLAPGTWVSTRLLLPETESEWRKLGAWQYLDVFRSEYVGSGDLSTVIAKTFPQLSALAVSYQDYVAQSESVLRHFEAGLLNDKACFAIRLQNLWEMYAIARDDPILPSSLLPEGWPRSEAESLSVEVQRVLAEPAERYFDTIYKTTQKDQSLPWPYPRILHKNTTTNGEETNR